MQVVNLLQLHDARYLWMEVDAFSVLMEIIGGHTLQIAVYFDGLVMLVPKKYGHGYSTNRHVSFKKM